MDSSIQYKKVGWNNQPTKGPSRLLTKTTTMKDLRLFYFIVLI